LAAWAIIPARERLFDLTGLTLRMNRPLIQCVVESLGLSGEQRNTLAGLGTFHEREWRRCLSWIDESGLALYFLKRMIDLDALGSLPATVRARLQQALAANQCRLSVMKEEFAALVRAFIDADVDFAVLKGFALIPEFCPDAALRSQYDYDFLVHPDSANAARQVLQARGFSAKVKSPGFAKEKEYLFAAQPLALPSPGQNFYSVNIPRAVELHEALWEPNGDMIGVQAPENALGRKRLTNWGGLSFPVLSEHDALVFQALHAFQHILCYWCRPSCFLEVAYFLAKRQYDALFWEQLHLRVHGRRYLPQILGLVFSLSALLFEAPLAPEVAAWTTRALPASLSQWVQRRGEEWALATFPGSKLSLFVHRAFIESTDVWKNVERSRLFPIHRPARVVESADQRLASRWQAHWEQACFALSRLKFHVAGLLRYTWELPTWRRTNQFCSGARHERT